MINNYKKIKNSTNNKRVSPIFFITPNPIYAIGLEKIIKNYLVICSQKSDVVDYFKNNKIPVLCLNDDKIKNAGKILANKKVVEYIKNKSKSSKANIITFKPSPTIQRICKDNDFRYLGNDWKLNRDLEDKIKFIEVTKKLKIPNANSKIIKLDENECALNFSKNEKFVIQLPRGFSGNSTFFIKNENDFNEILKKYKNRKVKLSKYFEGEAYTINACVAGGKILISKPIFQITGLTSYNKNKFGTCGNDYVYPEKLKKEQRKKIFNYTKKVGDYIKELGYKGIFGLDFVVSNSEDTECPRLGHSVFVNSEINLIEINPRIIGSMSLFTKLQIQNKEKPFLLSHILEFARFRSPALKLQSWAPEAYNKLSNNFNASQLMLRNTKNRPIKIMKNLKSGFYEIKKNKLVFKKGIYDTEEKMKKNEFSIQCSAKGSVISPDIEYANIKVSYGIMEDERKFKRCFNLVVKAVLGEIKIKIVKLSNC